MFGFSKLFQKKEKGLFDSILDESTKLDQEFFGSLASDEDYRIDTSEFQDKNFYKVVREGFGWTEKNGWHQVTPKVKKMRKELEVITDKEERRSRILKIRKELNIMPASSSLRTALRNSALVWFSVNGLIHEIDDRPVVFLPSRILIWDLQFIPSYIIPVLEDPDPEEG